MNKKNEDLGRELNKPRYDLSSDEIKVLEVELASIVGEHSTEEGVFALWIKDPNSRYANIVRTNEAKYFPEVAELDPSEEEGTMSLLVFDTRGGRNRCIHASTLWGLNYKEGSKETGMFTIDDLIRRENFTLDEFLAYYRNLDLTKGFSIETNFRIGERVEPFNGVEISDLAYLTIIKLGTSRMAEVDHAAGFASINEASRHSFDRVGLEYHPLMGRTDFHTSESELDRTSQPIVIPYSQHNIDLFNAISPLALPEIYI